MRKEFVLRVGTLIGVATLVGCGTDAGPEFGGTIARSYEDSEEW